MIAVYVSGIHLCRYDSISCLCLVSVVYVDCERLEWVVMLSANDDG